MSDLPKDLPPRAVAMVRELNRMGYDVVQRAPAPTPVPQPARTLEQDPSAHSPVVDAQNAREAEREASQHKQPKRASSKRVKREEQL